MGSIAPLSCHTICLHGGFHMHSSGYLLLNSCVWYDYFKDIVCQWVFVLVWINSVNLLGSVFFLHNGSTGNSMIEVCTCPWSGSLRAKLIQSNVERFLYSVDNQPGLYLKSVVLLWYKMAVCVALFVFALCYILEKGCLTIICWSIQILQCLFDSDLWSTLTEGLCAQTFAHSFNTYLGVLGL